MSLLATVLVASNAPAQRVGSLAIWKKRVLDPGALSLDVFPEATFNLKFTIDQIRLDETPAKMAVYLISVDDMAPAAEFFAKQLGVAVDVSGVGTMGEVRIIRAKEDDPKRAGLSIRVENAPWATGKGQIWLRYDAPAGSAAGT